MVTSAQRERVMTCVAARMTLPQIADAIGCSRRTRAVEEIHVRELFYRNYIDGEDDTKRSGDAQRMAFKRSLRKASIESTLVRGQKDNRGAAMLWFAGAEENYR
jgi:hypothetical protein